MLKNCALLLMYITCQSKVYLDSHKDVDYDIRNTVNNVMITMYGKGWVLEAVGVPLCKLCDFLTTLLYI